MKDHSKKIHAYGCREDLIRAKFWRTFRSEASNRAWSSITVQSIFFAQYRQASGFSSATIGNTFLHQLGLSARNVQINRTQTGQQGVDVRARIAVHEVTLCVCKLYTELLARLVTLFLLTSSRERVSQSRACETRTVYETCAELRARATTTAGQSIIGWNNDSELMTGLFKRLICATGCDIVRFFMIASSAIARLRHR